MKLRTQRIHHMGQSNRQTEMPMLQTKNVFETSYVKSQSSYYKTAQSLHQSDFKESQKLKNPFNGTHVQMNSLRWNSKAKKIGEDSQWKLENSVPQLDYQNRLNEGVTEIAKQFEGKDVNMFKLNELKKTFIKNNRTRRQLKEYFNTFAKNGTMGVSEMQNIVKQYGYDINADEAKLIFKLNGSSQNGLAMKEFVELMTKDNVYFRTLKIPGNSGEGRHYFEQKIHLVFKNKFHQLKEAFTIYRMRGEPIDQNKFNYVMKKLDINDLVVSKAERNQMFYKFSQNGQNFNVERMLCAIVEQQFTKKPTFPPKLSDFQANIKVKQESESKKNKKPHQYDFKRMSNPQYQHQLLRAQQVIWEINNLGSKGKQLVDKRGGTLNRDQLRQHVEKILQQNGINFNKQDYDCFTSYIDYNNDNTVTADQYKLFLAETPQKAQQRFDRRIRAQPPAAAVDASIYDEDIAISSLDKVKAKKLNPQMKVLFQQFDVDKDGFVSRNELRSKLDKLSVLQGWEIQNLANYFDPSGKGYVKYSQFAEKYSNSQKQIQSIINEPLNKLKSQSDWISTKRSFIKDANTFTYNCPSKYSAWPERLKRTDFSMLQPSLKAGQFISQDQRFNVTEKHSFGQQQKQQKNRVYQNKLRKLVAWNEVNQQRININSLKQQQRSQANDYSLRMTKQSYQAHCHNN